MKNYNDLISQCLSVTVTCNTHNECRDIAALFKKQCDAWAFQVRYVEDKPARNGDVLTRELMIYQTAYASNIIVFRESIRAICNNFDGFNENSVTYLVRGCLPEGGSYALLQ